MEKTTDNTLVTFVKAVGPLGQNIDTQLIPPLSLVESQRAIKYIVAYLAKNVAITVASLHGFIDAATDLWHLHGVAVEKILKGPQDLESYLFVASYYSDILKRGESDAWGPFATEDEEADYPESFIRTYISVSLLPEKVLKERYTAPHDVMLYLAGAQKSINEEDFINDEDLQYAAYNAADCCKEAVKAGIPTETMQELIEDCVAEAYLYAVEAYKQGGRASNPRLRFLRRYR